MNWIAEDAISLLMFLAPGLVVVGIFRSLTSIPPPSVFDQVVQALIFTIIVQTACGGIVELFERIFGESDASWTTPYPPHLSFPIAVALAVLLAATYGNDAIHRRLRRLRITRETSFLPSGIPHFIDTEIVMWFCILSMRDSFMDGQWRARPTGNRAFQTFGIYLLKREEVDEKAVFLPPRKIRMGKIY